MPGMAMTYARPGMAGGSRARGVASPTPTAFQRPQAAAAPAGVARTGNAGNLPGPLAGPAQKPTTPPQEYTDTLGNVFRWNAGGFTGIGANAGLSPGEWVNIGNTNRGGAGSSPGPSGDPGYDDFDWDAALTKVRGIVPEKPPPAPLPDRIAHPSEPDRRRAESLEFGRAKDRIGKLGQGAMRAMRNEMQSRGIAGSDYAMDRGQRIIAQQQGDLADVITQQAGAALERDQHATDRDYAGDVGQRTTDVGFHTSARGQDIDFETAKANQMINLLQLMASTRRRRVY